MPLARETRLDFSWRQALKRANELCSIGNKRAALQVLHDVLTAKRSRTWREAQRALDPCLVRARTERERERECADARGE